MGKESIEPSRTEKKIENYLEDQSQFLSLLKKRRNYPKLIFV